MNLFTFYTATFFGYFHEIAAWLTEESKAFFLGAIFDLLKPRSAGRSFEKERK